MKTGTADLPPLRAVKVLDQLRERIRYLHYSRRTEEAYVHWVRAFIRFHGIRHPSTMGAGEVEAFLSHLVAERDVAPLRFQPCCSSIAGCWILTCPGCERSAARASAGVFRSS